MKIFSYFSETPDIDPTNERKLIALWIDNWRAAGFNPQVLNESHAQKHPLFDHYVEAVSKFPSTNPSGYDLSCFVRWLAVAQTSDEDCGILCDYDCFNYGWAPILASNSKICLYQGHVPCLVSGRPKSFTAMAKFFMEFIPKEGENHISDMSILAGMTPHQSDKMLTFHLPIIKSYGEPGWDKSAAVHYPNAAMGPAKYIPRYKFIPNLRAQ